MTMKVLLIYPSYFPPGAGAQFPSPPLAIYVLGGIAQAAGFEVEIVDPSRYGLRIRQKKIVEELIHDVDIVGVSATSLNWHEALRFIRNVKDANGKAKIIVGGVHATHFDRHLLKIKEIDYVVRGEAEQIFPQLLEAIAAGNTVENIAGLSFRSARNEIVRNPQAEKPILAKGANSFEPLYEFIPEGLYNLFPVETSRGCPNSCFFCSIPYRHQWKGKEPTTVLEKIAKINNSYINRIKGNYILLVDDCFTANSNHVTKICDGIKERGFDNRFVIEARMTDLLKPAILSAVASLKLAQVQVGIECGYDEGLDKVGKTGLTIARVRECARLLKEQGIIDKFMLSFILGLPWETERECFRTIDFAAELVADFGGFANFSWWILLPSRGWEERHAYGIDIKEEFFDIPDWYADDALFAKTHPNITQEGVQEVRQRVQDYRKRGYALYGL
jgi:radical SAM superfamily enzyme YgiQ (UPF0313 family)